MNFIVIIPARYGSTRLPGKPLVDILGQPMIIRTVAAARASGAARVIVATDHPMVAEVVSASGTEVCTTAVHHVSGTDRLAEVVAHYQMADEQIVVNLQGDEPLTPPEIITQVADNLAAQCSVNIATLSTPIQQNRELFDPHIVKVVTDSTGCALYFSRAPLPWDRQRFGNIYLPTEISPSRNSVDHRGDNTQLKHEQATNLCLDKMNTVYQRHIGLYAYRAGFIRRYHQWAPTVLEQIEMLEQLRVLWYGETIHVAQALRPTPIGVDTPEDLTRICTFLAASLKANGQPSL